MDLWGHAPILSTTGARYFLLLIDHFSWFSWLHPLHNKNQALPTFIKFKALVENQFNSPSLCLLYDNSGEFRAFTSYLANHLFLSKNTLTKWVGKRKIKRVIETSLIYYLMHPYL